MQEAVAAIRPDCAIHLAWYAVPGKYSTAPENIDFVAISLALARALVAADCHKLVAAGTCIEYDWTYGTLSENETPLNPPSLYGVSKDATRRILQVFCEQAGMGFAWARIFFLYGPSEPPGRLMPAVIGSLLQNKEALCSDGVQRRDFLHVADVASAMVRLVQDDAQGIYNVGSGSALPVRDFIMQAADKIGHAELVRLGARKGAPEAPLVQAATDRLQGELGWRPRFDLDNGLNDTIAWWRKQLAGIL
jgi:nucleoside-diphosphate-sugar epimerase